MWFRALFLLSLAVLPAAGSAQGMAPNDQNKTEQYFFETFGEESGFLQTDVILAIARTRDGYLWLGTERGLTRFDGVRFVSFRASNTPQIVNNLVHCLFEDRDGWMWIGTERGVVRYRDGKFERGILDHAPVRSIAQDATGRLWLGTFGHGLYSWHDGALRSHAAELAEYGPLLRCVFVDSADRVWIGFQNHRGLVYREGTTFKFYDDNGTIKAEIQSICEQPRGTLWFGTGTTHRLFRLREGRLREFTPRMGLAASQVFDLKPSRDGGLWLAGGVLQKVTDLENVTITTLDRLPYDRVRTLCEDAEGSLWLGARDVGLVRARLLPYRLYGVADGLPKGGVKTVSQDPAGNLWFASEELAIGRLDPKNRLQMYPLPQRAMPTSAFPTGDGRILVGSTRLAVLQNEEWKTFPEIRGVYGIFEDSTGGVWMGTANGFGRFRDGELTPVPLEGNRVMTRASAFCEGPDGAIYVGTWDSGLVVVDGARVTVHDHRNGLPADHVRAVYVDRENRLWAGFRSRGLAVFEDGRWLNPNVLSEAAADHVSGIVEDDHGRLWLGTPAGVMSAPKSELLAAARGLQPAPRMRMTEVTEAGTIAPVWSGAQPVAWRGHQGKLFFATRRGILAVDPKNLPRNQVPPPVRIEMVTADHHELGAGREVRSPAGTRDLTIDFTALSLIESKHIAFEYRLDGYDADWTHSGNRRTAFYSRLPPGHYVFRVRARNSDGIWSEDEAQLHLVQEPRFYQTRWFLAAVLAVIGGMAWGFHRWRTAALRWENEKLNRLVANRTRDLELANEAIAAHSLELEQANRAKSEFLESVSHEIRNPLNGIVGLLGLLKRENQEPYARKLTDSVQACAGALTRAFEEVLGYSKLEHGNIEVKAAPFSLQKMLNDVVAGFAWQADQHGNTISVQVEPSFVDGYIGDEGKIKTIVSNFVGNAIKYAPGQPIDIRVEEEAIDSDRADVHIEVCDRGPGIPPEEQELVFRKFVRGTQAKKQSISGTGLGLASCRLLAESLQGNVGVESEPGCGATFYVCVPLTRAPMPHDAPRIAQPAQAGAGSLALIVEDEHYNQVVLSGIAMELGYAPEVADTVAQAVRLAEAKEFDVILVDWELRDGEGGDVARRVRLARDGQKPVIVATTAYDSDEIRARCTAAGMDDFLLKPYDAVQVRECIARVRARRSGQQARAVPAMKPATAPGLNLQAFQFYGRRFPAQADKAAELYVDSLEQEFAQLKIALVDRDRKRIGASSHRVHALGGLIGATGLVDAARKLTAAARQGADFKALQAGFEALVGALEQVKEQLAETKGV